MTPEDPTALTSATFPLPPLPHDAAREVRGLLLAAREKGVLALSPASYRVVSQHATGNRDSYVVSFPEGRWRCTCEDFLLRHLPCKHAFAVRAHVLGAPQLPPSPPRRKTYPQAWPAYTQGQLSEFRLFHTLLFDLVGGVQDPRPPLTLGRPRLPFRDVLFCAVQKVYAQRSLRRAYGLFELAEGTRQIRHAPSFVLPAQLLRREDVTPILDELVAKAALPLAALEESFAVDSSGFRTTSFGAYCQETHGPSRRNIWLKGHIIVGVRTHAIPKVVATLGTESDAPQFPGLVRGAVAAGFVMKEVYADKGYLSRENLGVAASVGATPYIPFKSNSIGAPEGYPIWRRMYDLFQTERELFETHYHLRSNVEATIAAVKAKLGETLRSRDPVARMNELLCKVLAYNLTVLVHEMFEHHVVPDFLRTARPTIAA